MLALAALVCQLAAQEPASFALSGDWSLRVSLPGTASGQTLRVTPAALITVTGETYEDVPVFNPKAGGWIKGAQLKGVRAQETTSPKLLVPESLVIEGLTRGKDYEADLVWGTFGRLTEDNPKTMTASYRHAQMRLDSVILTADGRIVLRQGEPRAAAPRAPRLAEGERLLGNIYLPGYIPKLTQDNLFPVLEEEFPDLPATRYAAIARIVKKIRDTGKLRILAWGDSVTDGSYLANPGQRWQEQFVSRLRSMFPDANIELVTEAWGGRNTSSYLNEPPGSVHNYEEKVLAVKPDVVISEFVNDAGSKPAVIEERYTKLLKDFQNIGAEWIILTPHYVRPDWMNLDRERDIDDDPRPYVTALRAFAARHKDEVALADASLRYGRLWRQGIPYNTLMLNAINHPDARGMQIFADALMALFEE